MQDTETLDQIKNRPRVSLARTLARKLLKDAGLNEAPISIQKLGDYLKEKHDLELQGLKNFFSEKVSGLTVTIDGAPTIGFNKDHGWYRRRFTIGHEIGHFLMSTAHYKQSGELGNLEMLETASPIETEANEFAAELLMPLQQFKKDFRSNSLNIDQLSEKYQVSREAAGWRLSRSGVLAKL